jgi:hypothetical protein
MPRRRRQRPVLKTSTPAVAGALALLAVPAVLSACSTGSGSPSAATSGGATPAKASVALCQQLNGVFADGPDPGADPVGYALSQILPLQDVHSSNASVMATVSDLVRADQDLVKANGDDKAATAAIKKDDNAIDRACPGVAP